MGVLSLQFVYCRSELVQTAVMSHRTKTIKLKQIYKRLNQSVIRLLRCYGVLTDFLIDQKVFNKTIFHNEATR